MTIQRKDKEIIVKITTNKNPFEIQNIFNYLRYEELASNSSATDKDIDSLVAEVKKGRWDKAKAELAFDE